jgi:hypothetical protein
VLLGNAYTEPPHYAYGTLTLSGAAFQPTSTSAMVSHSAPGRQTGHNTPHNPLLATPAGYHTSKVWPHPISLATTLGITIVFSSYRY